MEIFAGPQDWTHNDEEQFSKFLETDTGKRLIPKIVDSMPSLLDAGDTNAILIRSGIVQGIQSVIQTLYTLAHPPAFQATPQADEYPRLEDDAAWDDGQKLNPEAKKE